MRKRRISAFAAVAFFAAALAASSHAQSGPRFRGISAVSPTVAWASGSGGTVAVTTDGDNWKSSALPGAQDLDFRDIHGFDDKTAVVLSIGAGESSRIYRTEDGGASWSMVYQNRDPKVFLDAMGFWDSNNGIVMGDPVDGRFHLLRTEDGGRSWAPVDARMPETVQGEAAFAASGTCIAVFGSDHVWIASGGARARVFRSSDRGSTWDVADSPLLPGESAGIFSIAFRDALNGIVVGGDYKKERTSSDNVAITTDGGKTWKLAGRLPGYRSAVALVRSGSRFSWISVGPSGTDESTNDGKKWKMLSPDGFHAVAADPSGKGIWAVGEAGSIAKLSSGK